jgi:hypothetical protein
LRGVTPANPTALPDSRLELTERLLDEGTMGLIEAAKMARANPMPCLRTLLRGAISGDLEAIKQAGRWTTSVAAFRRWLARKQQQRRRTVAAIAPARADADAVLERFGLGREQQ